jgi:hypothetical protein
MEPVALSVVAALALAILFRRPGTFAPVLAFTAGPRQPPPGDDEEQMPETDRAPRAPWLGLTVASVAALRLLLLVTLHA